MRLVFLAQLRFMRDRMTPVLGARVTGVLGEIVQRRRALLDDAMEALGLQYPDHAEALQTQVLRRIGLRFEMDTYAELRGEAFTQQGVVQGDRPRHRDTARHPPPTDHDRPADRAAPAAVGVAAVRRAARGPAARHRAAADHRARDARRAHPAPPAAGGLGVSDQLRRGGVSYEGRTLRLGRGALFGGDGLLDPARTQGAVTAVRFCHLLLVPAWLFRRLVAQRPELADATAGDGVSRSIAG